MRRLAVVILGLMLGSCNRTPCMYNDLVPGQPFKVPERAYREWVYGNETSIEWGWWCEYHHCTHRVTVDRDTVQYLSSW